MPLASSTRHIGERCLPTLGDTLQFDIFLAEVRGRRVPGVEMWRWGG